MNNHQNPISNSPDQTSAMRSNTPSACQLPYDNSFSSTPDALHRTYSPSACHLPYDNSVSSTPDTLHRTYSPSPHRLLAVPSYTGIITLGAYHRYYTDRLHRIRNSKFDGFSTELLNLKCMNPWTIRDFYKMLNPIIPRGISICTVPPSKSSTTTSGIREVAKLLCADPYYGRKDRICFLIRKTSIPNHSDFAPRNKSTHLLSIIPAPGVSIKGERIILLDDITTTGFSLKACRDILLLAGAASVSMLALAQTIYDTAPEPEALTVNVNNPLTVEDIYA